MTRPSPWPAVAAGTLAILRLVVVAALVAVLATVAPWVLVLGLSLTVPLARRRA